jgi:hypothetical protein
MHYDSNLGFLNSTISVVLMTFSGLGAMLTGKFDMPSTGRIDLVRGCLNNPSRLV